MRTESSRGGGSRRAKNRLRRRVMIAGTSRPCFSLHGRAFLLYISRGRELRCVLDVSPAPVTSSSYQLTLEVFLVNLILIFWEGQW